MKTSEKLQKRLLEDLGIAAELPQKIPRGRHGRSGGQWAWCARYKYGHGAGEIGSEDTMTECVKATSISSYNELSTGQAIVCADSEPPC